MTSTDKHKKPESRVGPPLRDRIRAKKRRLDALRPLPKEALDALRHQINIELTYNSNAIEGNTLTLQETRMAIEEGITSGGKPLKHYLEAANHEKALEFVEGVAKDCKINEELILQLHELVMQGVSEDAGRFRTRRVEITGATFRPPEPKDILPQMAEMMGLLKAHLDAIDLAALIHYELVRIHPFSDGNGRTARLLMNLVLIRNGYPPTILLFDDRKKYYRVLRASDKGDEKPLINFIARSVEQSLNRYLHALEKPTERNKLIKLSEAAQHCDYSQEYLSLLSRKGALGATKINGNWMVTREELDTYLKSASARKK